MRSRRVWGTALWSLLAAFAVHGCAVRVGSGGPPPPSGDPQKGEVFGASACARAGSETKIPFGSGAQSFAFAWSGDHYLVVYPEPSGEIFAARLAPDGTPMGPSVDVQMMQSQSDLPSLVATSTGYMAAWEAGSAGNVVYMRALDANAMPVGPGVTVAATQLQQSRPVLAPGPGGKVVVAWMDQFDDGSQGVQLATVDPVSVQVVATQRMASPDVAGWPWIAGDDQALAMVWRDQAMGPNGSPSYDISFATVDPQGPQPSAAMSLRGMAKTEAHLPRMIRTGFGFLAAWEDTRIGDNEIFMALVDPSGGRIGGGLVEEPNSGDANWPNMAWTGKTAGVVYYQWRESRPQVFMSFVDGTGTRVAQLHDLQVSNGTIGWSKYPDVVWTGNEFGVMYVDTRDGQPALWFQRVSCHGG